jgi:ATP adenylyltransferase
MKYLWSPWRMKYIEQDSKEPGCIFCDALAKPDGEQNVVMRGEHAFVILNKFPYTSGHLMIAPREHRPTLEVLDTPTRGEMMELVSTFLTVLRSAYFPQAFNVGANLGVAAGAGVPDHVHMHRTRWAGDTSFIYGGLAAFCRIVGETHRRVLEAWQS